MTWVDPMASMLAWMTDYAEIRRETIDCDDASECVHDHLPTVCDYGRAK